MFRAYIDEHITLRLLIKECAELDTAIQYFTTLIHAAAWYSTPSPLADEACYYHSSVHTRDNCRDNYERVADGSGQETKATD
jgi:hypothetical protein